MYGHITHILNTLRQRKIGCHFADDIFKYIFLNEIVWIPIKISLKSVPECPINNIPALVQIMAWRRPGDKPSSGPIMVSLLTHICVTRPQWVKASGFNGMPLQLPLCWHVENNSVILCISCHLSDMKHLSQGGRIIFCVFWIYQIIHLRNTYICGLHTSFYMWMANWTLNMITKAECNIIWSLLMGWKYDSFVLNITHISY